MNDHPMRPSAIAFDVGGVLYYDQPFEVSWLQEVWNLVRCDTTWSDFGRAAARYFAMKARGCRDIGLLSPAGTHAWSTVRANWMRLAQPVDGMLELLASLAHDHQILIVANQPPESVDLLSKDHINADVVALDSLVGYSKPDPRLLAWALHRANIASTDTIVIGDSILNDERPATRLGCRPILFLTPDGWTTPAGVSPAVDDLYRNISATAIPPGRPVRGMAAPDEITAYIDTIFATTTTGGTR